LGRSEAGAHSAEDDLIAASCRGDNNSNLAILVDSRLDYFGWQKFFVGKEPDCAAGRAADCFKMTRFMPFSGILGLNSALFVY
jgi:hypothetical protein